MIGSLKYSLRVVTVVISLPFPQNFSPQNPVPNSKILIPKCQKKASSLAIMFYLPPKDNANQNPQQQSPDEKYYEKENPLLHILTH